MQNANHPAKAVNDSGVRMLIEMTSELQDLRANVLTDKGRQEGAAAAQASAGHTTAEITAHCTKAREVEHVKPVAMKRSSQTLAPKIDKRPSE
ncbi:MULTISPECIES: hypothetical protein [Cupriavidus]|uniref:hypothetical protein n=1 Tax=Cupriavidus sp. DF5525 TaxID=3160989 RepID=UPI0003B0D490|nr:hypothetical protein N234_06720 [Ralstonia pickettii DTP0602]